MGAMPMRPDTSRLSDISDETELRYAALADEFADRLNRGDTPDPEDYARRCPELAARIRETFPLLLVMRSPLPARAPAARQADGSPERLGDFRIIRQLGRG